MSQLSNAESQLRTRNLLFMTTPRLWLVWPYLPLIRHQPGGKDDLGVLYDVYHVSGRTGFSATVILCNLFMLPATEEELLALPKEVYDSVEEIYAAGWRVD